MDRGSHPHLYKLHWKTPYRESHLNIRPKEKKVPHSLNTEHVISALPSFDPSNPEDAEILKEQQGSLEGLSLNYPEHDLDSDELKAELWKSFENGPKILHDLHVNHSPYFGDFAHEYNPLQIQFRDRDASGWGNEARMKQMFVDLEYWIEEVIGEQQIREKKVDFYKGTIKKWQILDDEMVGVDRSEIEKFQAAVQAPMPEELEMYAEKHTVPMQVPFNNANVTAWRDEPRATDSADFDPDFLAIDRQRRKKFFLERYEKPQQLSE